MKLASVIAGSVLVLLVSLPAEAQNRWRDDLAQSGQRYQSERSAQGDSREGGRQGDDYQRGGRGRDASAAPRDDQRSRGRLSPEERKQLRRDIDEAGRDIYRDRRQGRSR